MCFALRTSSRWIFVALLACALAVGGCGEEFDFNSWLMSYAGFGEVNLANGTNRTVAGRLSVADSTGGEMLEEKFRLAPGEKGVQFQLSVEGDSSIAVYENVFPDPGPYTISVNLSKQVGGTASLEQTVEIDEPRGQHVVVAFTPEATSSDVPSVRVVRVPE